MSDPWKQALKHPEKSRYFYGRNEVINGRFQSFCLRFGYILRSVIAHSPQIIISHNTQKIIYISKKKNVVYNKKEQFSVQK